MYPLILHPPMNRGMFVYSKASINMQVEYHTIKEYFSSTSILVL
jgi:hypothetical protein